METKTSDFMQQLGQQVAANPSTPDKQTTSQKEGSFHNDSAKLVAESTSASGHQNTIFIGIAGGTASGKTTVCQEVFERVQVGTHNEMTVIALDCFYKECTPEQMANIGQVNFDHPDMFDWELLKETLQKLKDGKDVVIPEYNYVTCKREKEGIKKKWSPLIMYEGIFGLLDKEINSMLDLKIFVQTDDDIRLARRIERDIAERGRDVVGVLKSYFRFVKPAFEEFVRPTVKYADIIVPRGRPQQSKQNNIAIDFIVHNLEYRLVEAGYSITVPADSPGIKTKGSALASKIEVCDKTELEAVHNQIKEREDKATTVEVIGTEEPKEAIDLVINIS